MLLLVVLLALLMISLFFMGILYFQYRTHPIKKLSDQVLERVYQVEKKWQNTNSELARINKAMDQVEDQVREEVLQEKLAKTPCSALQAYPGIGEGTTSKLASEGIQHLQQLKGCRLTDIPGIGPSREREIRSAAKQLEKRVRQQLENSKHPIGLAVQEKIEQTRWQYEMNRLRLQGREHALRQILRKIGPANEAARKVDFFVFLNRRWQDIATNEMESSLLINLDATIEKGETKYIEERVAKLEPKIVTPIPEITKSSPASSRPSNPSPMHNPAPPSVHTTSHKEDLFLGPQKKVTPSEDDLNPTFSAQTFVLQERAVSPLIDPVQRENDFHRAAIAVGCAIARIHGRFTKAEKEKIFEYIQEKALNNEVLRNLCAGWLGQYEKGPIDWQRQLDGIDGWLDPGQQQEIYDLAARIADATSGVQPEEAEFLEKLKRRWPTLQIESKEPTPLKPSVAHSGTIADKLVSPRQVLDIPDHAVLTVDLIRRQYNLLTQRLDPQRAAAIDPELVSVVSEKRARVEVAARELMGTMGVPWDQPEEPKAPKDLRHNPDLDALFGD